MESRDAHRGWELFDHRFSARATAAQKQVRTLLDEEEMMEELNKQIVHEMQEFFIDTTRIAAKILGSIEERKAQLIEEKVLDEMRDFFEESQKQIQHFIHALKERQISKKEVENAFGTLLYSTREPLQGAASHAEKEVELRPPSK